MVNKLTEFKIGVYHHDCMSSESTEKFPEAKVRQESPITMYKKKEGGMHYTLLWSVEAPTQTYLDNYLEYLKGRNDTVELDVLHRTDTSAHYLQRVRTGTLSYDEILKGGLVYAEPVEVENGFEIHTMLSKEPKDIKKLLEELEAIGQVKLIRVGDFKKKDLLYGLTPKQLDALKLAYSKNYYSWPKSANLEQLAQLYGTSRRGFQESLRKAESKVMPEIIKEILGRKDVR